MSRNRTVAMFLSVIVPTCDRPETLALCLQRLAPGRQSLAAERYEVIVTDDGADRSAERLLRERFLWARWTQGPRRGPAANRNRGVTLARGDWLVFTDDDCLPCPTFLGGYAAAIERFPDVQVFEGRTSSNCPKQHPFDDAPINAGGGLFWSCNLAVAAELFRRMGGFDESFPFAAMEDMEFSHRFRKENVGAAFVPEAEVIHPWRRLEVKAHARRHVASQLIYLRLHPDERSRFTFVQHCRNVARYYVRDFPAEVRQFGWLAFRCQPLRWWEAAFRGWQLLTRLPKPPGRL